ncbi:MAG: MATE family efflux transporter [Clostridia bacterium]|nr:MATE family efflux transporter [Clostridia bacterium]
MAAQKIRLSDHFTYRRLFRFALPSVAMMIFTSIYGVVDGYFVSNFVGKTPFAALNFIMPFLMILGTFGFMMGSGGSALVSKTLGEGDGARANSRFSLFVYVTLGAGTLVAVLGILLLRPVAALLGAEGAMLSDCVTYGRVILMALPAYMLQLEFQIFFVTAEKPGLSFVFTAAAGCANMLLDALFVAVFGWGLVGAAAATAASQAIGGFGPLLYFLSKNSSILRLGKTKLDIPSLARAMGNGSSELMSNVSMSLVGMLYNVQLMAYAGEDGVAAYGALMYVNFIFIAVFIGYTIAISPPVGYHYGAGNTKELGGLYRKSMVIILVASVVMTAAGLLLAYPLSYLFTGYDEALLAMTVRGFFFFSFSFLFAGLAIFGSAFFTALNNGAVSALLSFLRTLVFQVAAVLLLPLFLGLDGIWLSIVLAEGAAALLSLLLLWLLRGRYHY